MIILKSAASKEHNVSVEMTVRNKITKVNLTFDYVYANGGMEHFDRVCCSMNLAQYAEWRKAHGTDIKTALQYACVSITSLYPKLTHYELRSPSNLGADVGLWEGSE